MDIGNELIAGGDVATLLLAGGTFWLAWKNRALVIESEKARGQWTALALDTARARLDSKAPVVDLTISDTTGPLLPSTVYGGVANPCPPSQRWIFPRDEGQVLMVRCKVTLTNHGKKTVHAKVIGSMILRIVQSNVIGQDSGEWYVPDAGLEDSILPGESLSFWLEARHTVKKWSENEQQGVKGRHFGGIAQITVRDDDDNGVDDSWIPMLTDTPIEPEPGNDSGWQLRPAADPPRAYVEGGVPQRNRTYWLSRSMKKQLPLPAELQAHYDEVEAKRREEHPGLFEAQVGREKPRQRET